MGIKGLLPFLRPITQAVNLAKYSRCRLGVDAMCWMHRAAVSCAVDIATGKGSCQLVEFFMKMTRLLIQHDIQPLIVFDGAPFPGKRGENDRRERLRRTALESAKRLIDHGVPLDDVSVVSKCVEGLRITSGMINCILVALKIARIDWMVAPFEADAQLSFLCRVGEVDAVITEDSDLLAYGCPRVLFKLDRAGNAQEIDISFICELKKPLKDLSYVDNVVIPTCSYIQRESESQEDVLLKRVFMQGDCYDESTLYDDSEKRERNLEPSITENEEYCKKPGKSSSKQLDGHKMSFTPLNLQKGELYNLRRFSLKMFTVMCILAGSDYTCDFHILGMGIRTACKLVHRFKSMPSVFRFIKMTTKWRKRMKLGKASTIGTNSFLSSEENEFSSNQLRPSQKLSDVEISHFQAVATFLYQLVYDPQSSRLIPLRSNVEELSNGQFEASVLLEFPSEIPVDVAIGRGVYSENYNIENAVETLPARNYRDGEMETANVPDGGEKLDGAQQSKEAQVGNSEDIKKCVGEGLDLPVQGNASTQLFSESSLDGRAITINCEAKRQQRGRVNRRLNVKDVVEGKIDPKTWAERPLEEVTLTSVQLAAATSVRDVRFDMIASWENSMRETVNRRNQVRQQGLQREGSSSFDLTDRSFDGIQMNASDSSNVGQNGSNEANNKIGNDADFIGGDDPTDSFDSGNGNPTLVLRDPAEETTENSNVHYLECKFLKEIDQTLSNGCDKQPRKRRPPRLSLGMSENYNIREESDCQLARETPNDKKVKSDFGSFCPAKRVCISTPPPSPAKDGSAQIKSRDSTWTVVVNDLWRKKKVEN